ncbi:MAG: hypothetical protein SPF70_00435 [Lachnospiraceae bacterium]|nr:hypothetical protein [Lachnospiraceae bacterium]
MGQKAIMKNLVENYNPKTAPAINVPKVGHTISGPNGIVSRSTQGIDSARQQKVIESADNIINDHLKSSDLSAALGDL